MPDKAALGLALILWSPLLSLLTRIPAMRHLTAFFALALSLTACGYGAKACKVIDAAHDVCTVVRYMAPDGTVREVQVSSEELAAFGTALEAKRAQPDGGAK
jgi:hypothetical protein